MKLKVLLALKWEQLIINNSTLTYYKLLANHRAEQQWDIFAFTVKDAINKFSSLNSSNIKNDKSNWVRNYNL